MGIDKALLLAEKAQGLLNHLGTAAGIKIRPPVAQFPLSHLKKGEVVIFATLAGIGVGAGKGLLAHAEMGLGRVKDEAMRRDAGSGVVGKVSARAGLEGGWPGNIIPRRLDDYLSVDNPIDLGQIMV